MRISVFQPSVELQCQTKGPFENWDRGPRILQNHPPDRCPPTQCPRCSPDESSLGQFQSVAARKLRLANPAQQVQALRWQDLIGNSRGANRAGGRLDSPNPLLHSQAVLQERDRDKIVAVRFAKFGTLASAGGEDIWPRWTHRYLPVKRIVWAISKKAPLKSRD
jgi:hypothetical protein